MTSSERFAIKTNVAIRSCRSLGTYDVASRVTSIVNANATIARAYFNDNLLNTETTTYPAPDNVARTVTYTYDADARRATIQYPNGAYSFTYNYTNRSQLKTLVNNSGNGTIITYGYDLDGDLTTRPPNNSTTSTYSYDGLDRVTNISHALVGTTRTLAYGYDNVSNRTWQKRDSGNGDVFGYDKNDQSISILLNVASPDTTSPGSQTINYDANGNRTSFSPYGSTDTYTTNNLNQYTARNSNQATYDPNGNMTTGVDGSTYIYDSQNRLLSATKNGTTDIFTYDGLNRQVSRKIGTATPLYKVYDGWQLIGEYNPNATSPLTAYLTGAGGLVKGMTASSSFYYYQDASGSTSHLTDNTGHLSEWYRYDLQGTPLFFNTSNTQIPSSTYGIRHLFTGQQWYSEIGLYDLRNRYYSPDIGRFVQTDPIGFLGGRNLYRYCANNPISYIDPSGLWTVQIGLSWTFQYGTAVFSGGFGLAFDGHGSVGVYTAGLLPAVGAGATGGVGVTVAGSNADTIQGLEGPFAETGVQVGDELAVSAGSFTGTDSKTGRVVSGTMVTIGGGEGVGAYSGVSTTGIIPLIGTAAPTRDVQIQEEIPASDGRVIVVGVPIEEAIFKTWAAGSFGTFTGVIQGSAYGTRPPTDAEIAAGILAEGIAISEAMRAQGVADTDIEFYQPPKIR